MLREGAVETADVAVDRSCSRSSGSKRRSRARVSGKVTIAAGRTSARVVADVRDAIGRPLAQPVSIHVEALADARGTCADADVASVRRSRRRPRWRRSRRFGAVAAGTPACPTASICSRFTASCR
jgi:hypothetical protein